MSEKTYDDDLEGELKPYKVCVVRVVKPTFPARGLVIFGKYQDTIPTGDKIDEIVGDCAWFEVWAEDEAEARDEAYYQACDGEEGDGYGQCTLIGNWDDYPEGTTYATSFCDECEEDQLDREDDL
jgi:hypothetical protein